MTRQPRFERTTATAEQAAALASAVRLRILRLTYRRPMTNKEIAGLLGKDPATVLHHVRKLVDTGFLEALPARRGTRGAREIPYQATGLSWRLRGDDLPVDTSEAMLQAFLGEIADLGATNVLEQTRLIMQLDAAGKDELRRRMQDLLDEFAGRAATPGAERTAVYLAFYPGE